MSDNAMLLFDTITEVLRLWGSLEFRENLLSFLKLPLDSTILEARNAIVIRFSNQDFRGSICFLIGNTYSTGTKR
jgi:hypothetical protein